MATNIIYKGEKVGTQVDFQTGSLTDISTFTGDVRGAAIENQIVDGVTDIGASQDAIHSMSGYLAANAHPSVSAAADTGLDLSNGNVIQDIDLAFDDLGHVETATFTSIDLDGRYYQQSDVQTISGVLNAKITGNDGDISINATDIVTLSGLITGNDGDISINATDIVTLSGLITGNDGDISINATDIVTLSGLITGNDGDISINATDIVTLSGLITGNDGDIATNAADIDILSGLIDSVEAYDLDDVSQNGSFTSADVEVKSLRVSGDGSSASITGPAIITIDPDAEGVSGKVVIAGDLQVDGTTTTINSTSVQIDDLSLVLGTGAPDASSADGGGIIIDGTGVANIAEFTFDGSNNRWKTNSIDIAANIVGTATSAEAWSNLRDITLGGDLSGTVSIDGSTDETLTATIGAGVVENTMLEYDSVAITGGAGLAGGGNAVLGGSAVSLSVGAGNGLTANTDDIAVNVDGTTIEIISDTLRVKGNSIGTVQLAADSVTSEELDSSVAGENITFNGGELQVLDADIRAAVFPSDSTLTPDRALVSDSNGKVSVSSTISTTELSHLNSVSSNIQTQLNAKADDSTEMSAGNGLTGGGNLTADRNFSTTADQGHLDEIELGTSNTTASNVVTKGGILILRGTDNNGITTSGSDGNAVALNDKTTVAFEGVVQSTDTAQDADNGTYVAMWKIQGVIRRDSNSTDMLSSFVTKTFAGSSASSYGLSVSVNGSGLKIASDQTTATLITSATINYNWVEETN
jgi:hypothetical protein